MNKTLIAIAAIGLLVGFNAGQSYERYRATQPVHNFSQWPKIDWAMIEIERERQRRWDAMR